MNKKNLCFNSLSRFAHCLYASGSIYVPQVMCASIQEIIELHEVVRYCYFEAKVRSSSVSTFAHNIFEGSPSKEGFHGTQ